MWEANSQVTLTLALTLTLTLALTPTPTPTLALPPNQEHREDLPGNQRGEGELIPVRLHADCSRWAEARVRGKSRGRGRGS